jgi:hypothetical protein
MRPIPTSREISRFRQHSAFCIEHITFTPFAMSHFIQYGNLQNLSGELTVFVFAITHILPQKLFVISLDDNPDSDNWGFSICSLDAVLE